MAQWNQKFSDLFLSINSAPAGDADVNSILRAFIISYMQEGDTYIWISKISSSAFGKDTIFVNDNVLSLGWTFAEWESGVASAGILVAEEKKVMDEHIAAVSQLPIGLHFRRKTTPPPQMGDEHIVYVLHDFYNGLRIIVAEPL